MMRSATQQIGPLTVALALLLTASPCLGGTLYVRHYESNLMHRREVVCVSDPPRETVHGLREVFFSEQIFEIDDSHWCALGCGPELTCGASLSHSFDATQYRQESLWS